MSRTPQWVSGLSGIEGVGRGRVGRVGAERWRSHLRERMCRATCWGRVNVDWQTGHCGRGEQDAGGGEGEGRDGTHLVVAGHGECAVEDELGEEWCWWKKVKSGTRASLGLWPMIPC